MMHMGYQIITDPNMTERVLHARSPARAKRRAKLGHPQHHVIRPMRKAIQMGDRLVMHPAMAAELQNAVRAKQTEAA